MPEPNTDLVHDLFVAVTNACGHDVQIGQDFGVVMPLVESPLEAAMRIVQAARDADCIEAIVVLPTQYIVVAPLPPSSAEGPELCMIPRQHDDLDGAKDNSAGICLPSLIGRGSSNNTLDCLLPRLSKKT